MRKIISIPHESLRKKASPVNKVDKKLLNFVSSLEETLVNKRNPRGVGLAAPQVDKLWRIFAMNIDGIATFINPIIIKKSKEMTLGPDKDDPFIEGCLSMPDLYGPVFRNTWVEAEYQYLDGNKLSKKKARFEGLSSRVFQHEIDHLDGILFTDYSLESGLPVYKEVGRNKYEEVDPALLKMF